MAETTYSNVYAGGDELRALSDRYADGTPGDELYETWQDESQQDEVRKLAWQEHLKRHRTDFLVASPWASEEQMTKAWKGFRQLSKDQRQEQMLNLLTAIEGASSVYANGRDVDLFKSTGGRDLFGRVWNFLKRP